MDSNPTVSGLQNALASYQKHLETIQSERVLRDQKIKARFPEITVPDLSSLQDRLTSRIQDLEHWLSSQAWKTETRLILNTRPTESPIGHGFLIEEIGFVRHNHNWRFVWQDLENTYLSPSRDDLVDSKVLKKTLLSDCSIERKSQFSQKLPELIDAMQRAYTTRLQTIEAGHVALDAVEALLRDFAPTATTRAEPARPITSEPSGQKGSK